MIFSKANAIKEFEAVTGVRLKASAQTTHHRPSVARRCE